MLNIHKFEMEFNLKSMIYLFTFGQNKESFKSTPSTDDLHELIDNRVYSKYSQLGGACLVNCCVTGLIAYLLLRSSRSAVSSAESSVSSSMAGDFDSDNCKSLVLSVFTSVAPLLAVFTDGSSLLKLSWMGSLDLRGIGAWATGELAACATAAAAASASFT